MSKPDWEDAPRWANYLAMDANGQWKWHKIWPDKFDGKWVSGGSEQHAAWEDLIDWKETLELRP